MVKLYLPSVENKASEEVLKVIKSVIADTDLEHIKLDTVREGGTSRWYGRIGGIQLKPANSHYGNTPIRRVMVRRESVQGVGYRYYVDQSDLVLKAQEQAKSSRDYEQQCRNSEISQKKSDKLKAKIMGEMRVSERYYDSKRDDRQVEHFYAYQHTDSEVTVSCNVIIRLEGTQAEVTAKINQLEKLGFIKGE